MMKFYVRQFISIVCVVSISITTYAVDPKFDLKNKTDSSIQFQINDEQLTTIGANKSHVLHNINVKDIKTLHVYYCPTASYCKTNMPDALVVEFRPGTYETMYIKLDKEGSTGRRVAPQKGSLLNKTTDGYSLSKNIKASDILSQHVKRTARPTGASKPANATSAKPEQQAKKQSTSKKSSPEPKTAPKEEEKPKFIPKKAQVSFEEAALLEDEAWAQFSPEAKKWYDEFRNTKDAAKERQYARAVLGVKSTATEAEIKKAYLKLVQIWHPDKKQTPLAGVVFKIINEAKSILDNKGKWQEDLSWNKN